MTVEPFVIFVFAAMWLLSLVMLYCFGYLAGMRWTRNLFHPEWEDDA